ncbi:uncharacterized protein LOC135128543 isoform X2 [Zophobas morio]|uniref:uncharacterized protein LOC135128543 isoform X2 n=1 Tax=Zophobas morio TaxID=2755281 RepID=UPI003083DC60
MMDHYMHWSDYEDIKEQQSREHLIERLQGARNKLAPILDDVIMSASELMKRGCFEDWMLTPEQYQDIIWASQILQECDYTKSDRDYTLANVDVIVNNVSVNGKMMSVKDKSIIIDEATVLELLELYQNMGVIIQRLLTDGVRVNDSVAVKSSERVKSSRTSMEHSRSAVQEPEEDYDEFRENMKRMSSKQVSTPSPSSTSFTEMQEGKSHSRSASFTETDMQEDMPEETDRDVNPPEIKSTLSALVNNSSGDLHKKKSENEIVSDYDDGSKKKSKSDINEPSVFINIRCFSDYSDAEYDSADGKVIKCAKDCPSHYHIKLDGEPVTLKMNQNNVEDGTVYCINTGGDASDEIRIIIKQCPECRSTVIGSSTRIRETTETGESHESITLHGKQGDESNMAYSSDENESLKESEKCKCLQKGRVCTDISKVRCEEFSSPCSCTDTDLSRLISERKMASRHSVRSGDTIESKQRVGSDRSESKMDVLIDSDNVDKSTVRVHDDDREPSMQKLPSKIIRQQSSLALTRRRLCSSMEFDVTTVHTRLRDREIQHGNSHIVVELKKLGVDKILRACRPAKCCRKAILDERQRTALPYCVSLKSLPLMGNDVEVIKQSIDMSVKKIKNSMDLTQAHKDKLAFYVSLGKDDFKPNFDFPWVIPLYDVKLSKTKQSQDRFFVLKKNESIPTQTEPVNVDGSKHKTNKSTKSSSGYLSGKKYFLLKKPTSNSTRLERLRLRKRDYASQRRVRFRQKNNSSDYSEQNCVIKTCHQKRSIYKSKNIWSSISHDDWNFIFAQDNKELGLSNVDFTFGQTRISKRHYSKPSSKVSVHYEELSHLTKFVCPQSNIEHTCNLLTKASSTVKPLERGDYSFSSINVRVGDKKSELSNFELKRTKLISPKSMPNFWKRVSEELYYTSNALTVCMRRSQSLTKCQNVAKVPQVPQLEEPKEFRLSKAQESTNQIKLEYYVALVNGDLVWSNKLPLEPQNFTTFYNHSNKTKKGDTPGTPVEDPMFATRVTPEERARPMQSRKRRNPHNNSPSDSRSTISELPMEQVAQSQAQSSPSRRGKPPAELASYPLGPESQEELWAPHLVSEISLPRVHEPVKKQEVKIVEAEPEKPKSVCSEKTVCMGNNCTVCKSTPSGSNKKCFGGDIKINIKKTKDKGVRVSGAGAKSCNKEICEIYKNKNLMPDKPGTSSVKKSKDSCQKFTISAKENIEIYINDKKICLGKNKGKKYPKESWPEKKEDDKN